jgi:hypothetical protein
MNSKPTPEHIDALVSHVIRTLPDGITARKALVVTMLALIPRDYRRRDDVRLVLESLKIHEHEQLKFALRIEGGPGNGKQRN